MSITMQQAILGNAEALRELGLDITSPMQRRRALQRTIRSLAVQRTKVLRNVYKRSSGKGFKAGKLVAEVERIGQRISEARCQLTLLGA